MSNLPNPRRIPFVSCHDPRTGNHRRVTWNGETERFVVIGMPPEAFNGPMYIDLAPDAQLVKIDDCSPELRKTAVVITVFVTHDALRGL